VVRRPVLDMGAWQPSSSDEDVVKEQVPPHRDDALSSELDAVERYVVRDLLSSGGDIVNDLLWGNRYFVNNPLWCDGDVVRYPLLSDRDILKCPLSCGRVTVPGAVRCVEVKNSVLCNLDDVKDPCRMGAVSYEKDDPACCNFCVMNHCLTCKVLTSRSGAIELESASCDECAAVTGGGPRVKDQDSRANWRRRRRCSIVWWLLLFLLGAAPLASGQLRPKTDISSSRAEGGKLYVERRV
jgi:hypothetical protein